MFLKRESKTTNIRQFSSDAQRKIVDIFYGKRPTKIDGRSRQYVCDHTRLDQ